MFVEYDNLVRVHWWPLLLIFKENIVFYGNDNYRSANNEATVNWNDPIIKINWPSGKKIISNKDKSGISFKEFVKKI